MASDIHNDVSWNAAQLFRSKSVSPWLRQPQQFGNPSWKVSSGAEQISEP
jgi:hypothetical protein